MTWWKKWSNTKISLLNFQLSQFSPRSKKST